MLINLSATEKLIQGGGVNSLLSKTLIMENDKNDSDIWPIQQSLEKRYVALYTQALVK